MDNDICIIGGGSIGATLAYYLYRSGFRDIPVYFSSEESYREVEESKGIFIYDATRGQEYLVPVKPMLKYNSMRICRFVFNAVKAYDVPETIELMRGITYPGGVIIMLQNGFGSQELAEIHLHGFKIATGVVYMGSQRTSRNRVVYYGGNTILIGCRKGVCIDLFELTGVFKISGLEFKLVEDIEYYRWLKLALNAVVNPITALTRSRNKIILREEGLALTRLILREFIKAAEIKGYIFDEERLVTYIVKNIMAVADNLSSMAQDVIYGKKTEIDYINGYIAEILGDRGLVNRVLTLLVKLSEKTS